MEWLDKWVADHEADLIAVRRDIHAHPELARQEHRTTTLLASRLRRAGLSPQLLPGTGLICDLGTSGPMVGLRADIDALPLADSKSTPYASTVDGVCHACGHDVHSAVVLGAGLALAAAPELPGRVRLIYQPAEEVTPGGALEVLAQGVTDGLERVYALHCDPRLEVGRVGIRVGPITAASDTVEVHLSGPGGHTARPHLTADLVYALGQVITEVPALLSRVVDPRDGMSLIWGAVQAGTAANAIPDEGFARGTVRMLDRSTWHGAEKVVTSLIEQVTAPTGVAVEVRYTRGVPPVDNDRVSVGYLEAGVEAALGPAGRADTPQSMGGDDFGWYLEKVPGAMARLGVHGSGPQRDLHQGSFDADERAIATGVRVLVHTALAALSP